MKSLATLALLTLVLTPAHGAARNATGVDAQENVFGATNINAVVGHGGLTAGISAEGDVTLLSWPGPGSPDQLGYASSNHLDARHRPRFGAPEGAGVVLGLRCEDAAGEAFVTWLRDRATWTVTQDYGPEDGAAPHTRFVSATLGLTALVVDAVAPAHDVFVRQVTLRREAGSPARSCALLSYANLSPQPPGARVPELPIADWALDGRNDYAAVWDEAEGELVHFHPADQRVVDEVLDLVVPVAVDWGPVGAALREEAPDPSALLAALPEAHGEGAWVVMTTVPPPEQHQVGFDATDFCGHVDEFIANVLALPDTFPGLALPIPADTLALLRCGQRPAEIALAQGWRYEAEDAWLDAQDGELQGASLAAGEVAAALRSPLVFEDDVATGALVIGLGADLAAARAAARVGRQPAQVLADQEATLAAWLAERRLPETFGEPVRRVARRSLINLRVGTDAATGAIVASPSRQPPYYLDWPRDGAFFNVMLDVSGQSALVEKRSTLYASWQRREPVAPVPFVDPPPPVDPDLGETGLYPADAWEMSYYPDGAPGGLFRFEIDTTAFAVWTMVAHVGWAAAPADYLREHWDSIRRGAELLARWRDPATGLHAPAQEDDQASYKQTLHGAITTFGALDIAARAARLLGEDDTAARWEERAAELREAIHASFYDEAKGVFRMDESDRLPLQASGLTATGPTAWLVWPTAWAHPGTPEINRQLAHDLDAIRPALELRAVGGLYFMKNTLSLAMAGAGHFDAAIAALPGQLAAQATAGTSHFGEVMVVAEGPRAEQRVSTPHLWEGALFYLTVMAAEDPAALRRHDEVLPPSRVLPPAPAPPALEPAPDTSGSDGEPAPPTTTGGGGCQQGSGGLPSAAGLLVLLGLLAGCWRRRA